MSISSEYPLALSAIERVIEYGNAKHSGNPWQSVPPNKHFDHAMNHLSYMYIKDMESKEMQIYHAIIRLLMIAEITEQTRVFIDKK